MLAHTAAANATPRARYLTPPLTPSTSATSASASPPAPVTAIGYFAIVRAVRASARLTSTERLVLLTIAGHLDNATATAAVGIPRLAAETAFTTRTIERTVAALVAAGWLTRASAASRWGTNVYQVTPVAEDVRAAGPRRLHGRGTPDTGSGHPPTQDRPFSSRSSTLNLLCALRARRRRPGRAHTRFLRSTRCRRRPARRRRRRPRWWWPRRRPARHLR